MRPPAPGSSAATAAIDRYGDELFRFLLSMARDQGAADDAFSLLCENLWLALPRFRWESSFRTWAYALARSAGSASSAIPTAGPTAGSR